MPAQPAASPSPCSYERSSQFVGRALRMPEGANMDAIRARYDNGVLTLDGGCRAGRRDSQLVWRGVGFVMKQGMALTSEEGIPVLSLAARVCGLLPAVVCTGFAGRPSNRYRRMPLCSAEEGGEEGGGGQAHRRRLKRWQALARASRAPLPPVRPRRLPGPSYPQGLTPAEAPLRF